MLKPNGADPGPTVVWCGLPVATSLTADRGGERERERERERETDGALQKHKKTKDF